jgi:hypothetical protein
MLLKYQKIRDAISQCLNFPDTVLDLVPTAQENGRINEIVEDLKKWESVSKALQGGGNKRISLYGARALFDKLISDFPGKPLTHIRVNASIVNNRHFENGIVKLQGGKESELNPQEKAAVKIFLVEETGTEPPEVVDEDDDAGYAERILNAAEVNKRARVSKSKYRSTLHVSSTSNLCERLFSVAKLIMSPLRKHMDPDHVQCLLFLKANKNFWLGMPQIIQEILDNAPAGDGLRDEV